MCNTTLRFFDSEMLPVLPNSLVLDLKTDFPTSHNLGLLRKRGMSLLEEYVEREEMKPGDLRVYRFSFRSSFWTKRLPENINPGTQQFNCLASETFGSEEKGSVSMVDPTLESQITVTGVTIGYNVEVTTVSSQDAIAAMVHMNILRMFIPEKRYPVAVYPFV